MADFCKQCSLEIFGEDFKDLSNISDEGETELGRFPIVICEGCGVTQVNHEGICVSPDCLKNHGK